MQVAETHPGLVSLSERSIGGVENCLINLALSLREGTRNRQGTGHVSGVERVHLGAGVNQYHVRLKHAPIVVNPVQRVGVVTGGGNGVIAQAVTLFAGHGAKSTLQHTLTTPVLSGARQGTNQLFKTGLGDRDSQFQLLNFPLVLN